MEMVVDLMRESAPKDESVEDYDCNMLQILVTWSRMVVTVSMMTSTRLTGDYTPAIYRTTGRPAANACQHVNRWLQSP